MAARSSRRSPEASPPAPGAASGQVRIARVVERRSLERVRAAWRAGTRTLVMGVVNATPDSFHAGGRHPSLDDAVAAAERHVMAGADLLDVGGESTRPGADPVAADVELGRVVPLVAALVARRLAAPISIDTYKASVARAAVDAGAALVNDVSGGTLDPAMAATVAELRVPVVVGHLRGTPRDMARHATYADVVAEVRDELAARAAAFVAAGVPREDVLLDPGIGFAKRPEHSRELLRRLGELRALGFPLVVGVSRKGFVGEALRSAGVVLADDTSARLEGSLAAAVIAAVHGAAIVRVHDVAETRRALAVADAILHGA